MKSVLLPRLPEGRSNVAATNQPPTSKGAPRVNDDYIDLKRIIVEKGLLQKQTGYQLYKVLFTFSLLIASVVFLLVVQNPYWQMLNAFFMAVACAQVAFLGHDAGHRQIFPTARGNDLFGYFVGNLLSGVSFSWWLDNHNRHHSHSNDLHNDPDMDYPLFAFDPEQAAQKRGFARFIVKHQKYLFFPMLLLGGINLKAGGLRYLIVSKPKTRVFEFALVAVHLVAYLWLTIGVLGWWALPFILIHQGLLGLLLGSVFAPNHKGMPLIDGDSPPDFLRRQVLTSRNVKAHPFTDFWYGGLNYQIEHHLFPSIPRNRMRELQNIVRPFCEERAVAYYATGTLQSYREILDYMHEVGEPLRQNTTPEPENPVQNSEKP